MNNNNWNEWSVHVLAEIKRLNAQQESLSETLAENTKILAINTTQLEIHILGVKAAREQNDLLRKDLEARVKPLELHSARWEGALKLVVVLSLLVGLIAGLVKVFAA